VGAEVVVHPWEHALLEKSPRHRASAEGFESVEEANVFFHLGSEEVRDRSIFSNVGSKNFDCPVARDDSDSLKLGRAWLRVGTEPLAFAVVEDDVVRGANGAVEEKSFCKGDWVVARHGHVVHIGIDLDRREFLNDFDEQRVQHNTEVEATKR
jgi:hypothetical protein